MEGDLAASSAPGQLQAAPKQPGPAAAVDSGAEAMLRDGLLYLALSHAALIVSGLCAYLVRNTNFLVEDPLGVLAVLLASGWGVLSLLGFYKILRAGSRGVVSRWVWTAKIGLVIYGIIAIGLLLIVHNAGSKDTQVQCTFGFIGVMTVLLGRGVLFRRKASAMTGEKALRWFGLGFVCLAASMGFTAPPLLRPGWLKIALEGKDNEAGWGLAGAVLTIGWLAALYLGFRNLWFERSEPHAGGVRWSRRLAVVWAAVLGLIALSLAHYEVWTDYVAVLAGYLGVALGAGLGWALAQVRSRGRRLWPRYLVLCIPLAVLVGYSAAGITATVALVKYVAMEHPYYFGQYTFRKPWFAKQPVMLRRPLVAAVIWGWKANNGIYNEVELSAALLGLCAPEDTEAMAMSPTYKYENSALWEAWYEQEPDRSLAKALAIAECPATVTGIPMTGYDEPAGQLIGRHGTIAQIIQRLEGSYSDELRKSIIAGIPLRRPSADSEEAIQAVLQYCDKHKMKPDIAHVMAYVLDDCNLLEKTTRAWLADPTPEHKSSLGAMFHILSKTQDDKLSSELAATALNSKDPELRCIFLEHWCCRRRSALPSELRLQLSCLRGKPPGVTGHEQALAYSSLASVLFASSILVEWGKTMITMEDLQDVDKKVSKLIDQLEAKEKERAEARSSPKSQ